MGCSPGGGRHTRHSTLGGGPGIPWQGTRWGRSPSSLPGVPPHIAGMSSLDITWFHPTRENWRGCDSDEAAKRWQRSSLSQTFIFHPWRCLHQAGEDLGMHFGADAGTLWTSFPALLDSAKGLKTGTPPCPGSPTPTEVSPRSPCSLKGCWVEVASSTQGSAGLK